MFSIDQIICAHSKVKSGTDFPQYIQDLKALGVTGYETYVADGLTDYKGSNDFSISSPPKYELLTIADSSNAAGFKSGLKDHQQGKTDYPSFCKMCADTGVEKWIVSIEKMSCTYYDRAGNTLLEEAIPGS